MSTLHKALFNLTNAELSAKLNEVLQYSVLSELSQQVLHHVIYRLEASDLYGNVLDSKTYEKNTQCIMDLTIYAGRDNFHIRQVICNWLNDLTACGHMPSDVDHAKMWDDMQTVIAACDLAELLRSGAPAMLFVGAGPRGPKWTHDNWAICIYHKDGGEGHVSGFARVLTKAYPNTGVLVDAKESPTAG